MPKRSWIHSFVGDLSILSGVGLVSYGAWLVYHPAGCITLGALLLATGIAAAVRR